MKSFSDYHAFRRRKYEVAKNAGATCQADVFNCFNSFYHHRVQQFVSERVGEAEGERFGQYLRELNEGDSIACFPQGYYPAKALGNTYLGFLDTTRKITAPTTIRYLDDIVISGPNEHACRQHLLELQYVLDDHHLSLNDAKTQLHSGEIGEHTKPLDMIKKRLLEKREETSSYDGDEESEEAEEVEADKLTEEEVEYLTDLVQRQNVAQEDIELALSLMEDHDGALEYLTDPIFESAPHLLRELHRFIGSNGDDDGVVREAIDSRLNGPDQPSEYDIFWMVRILLDHFDFDQDVADLIHRASKLEHATPLVRAAILESNELEHGFDDMKAGVLRNGGSLLEVSAALYGFRSVALAKRNQKYKYVKGHGSHFAVLGFIAKDFD